MTIKHYLRFDRRIEYGSPEHFFHFMWGYLLPSLHTIKTLTDPARSQYLYRSCGPVMDRLITEIMPLFNYNFRLVSESLNNRYENINQLLVPRWDIALLSSHLLTQNSDADFYTLRMREELAKHTSLQHQLNQIGFRSELSSAIKDVKSSILQKIDIHANLGTYVGCYLLLARSSCPDFYAEGGKAEILGYGTSRRALLGIKEAAQKLTEREIPIRIFEPGKYSLTEQIKLFHSCKGVIGLKGAEFANLIWMKPHCQVILIKPTSMNTPPVQMELANILGLNYVEIEDDQGQFPMLDPEMITDYLEQP